MSYVELDGNNFDEEVLNSGLPVLVDFWAPWCSPCHLVSPIVEKIAGEYQGKLKVGKLSVEQAPEIAQRYGIMSIPCLMFFKNGKAVDQIIGAVPKGQIVEKVNSII